jgi:Tripartite tricarboxylate transporter TctB family
MDDARERPSARADLVSAAAWIAFGGGVMAGAANMDRLESQGATLFSMPGLVPGMLGGALAFMGLLLAARSLANGALSAGGGGLWPGWNRQLLVAAGLMLAYALGLVGRGVPFWLATLLFVAGFIAVFEWDMRGEREQRLRGIVMALVYGAGTSAVVSLVFERVFLVRLP